MKNDNKINTADRYAPADFFVSFFLFVDKGLFMKFTKKFTALSVLIIFCITSSCANNKELRRNTLIILGAAAGIVIAGAAMQESSGSSDSNGISGDEGDSAAGGGGGLGLLMLLGGMLGGFFGLGVDLALEPIDKKKSNIDANKANAEE